MIDRGGSAGSVPAHAGRYVRMGAAAAAGLGAGLLVTAMRSSLGRVQEIDFHVFYQSAQAFHTGRDLYATKSVFPNLNPPQFIVAFLPFTWMEEHTALVAWLAINALAAAAAAAIVWRELKLPRSAVAVMIGLAAAGLTTGLQLGLEEGHPIGLLALCLTAAWAADHRKQVTRCGMLIGVLVSLKPFFACLLIVAILRRQWQKLLVSGVTASAAVLFGIAAAGPHALFRWIEVGSGVTWFNHPLNASVAGLLARCGVSSPWIWVALSSALVGVTVVAVRRADDLDREWLACGLVSLLVSPLGWGYYLPLLAGPLTAVARRDARLLAAGIGFLWPLPLLMMFIPIGRWSAMTIISIMSWSLLAMWATSVQRLWTRTSITVESVSLTPQNVCPANH